MISWPPKEHTNDKAHKRLIVDAVHWVLQWFNGLQDSTNNQALVSDGNGSLAFKEVVTTEGGQSVAGVTTFNSITLNNTLTVNGAIVGETLPASTNIGTFATNDGLISGLYRWAGVTLTGTMPDNLGSVGTTYGQLWQLPDNSQTVQFGLFGGTGGATKDFGIAVRRKNNGTSWNAWTHVITDVGGQTIPGVTLSADLVINESADHSETPTAGKGQLWVKNDTPCTLYFTDDAGTDHQLGVGIQYPDAITGHIKAGNTQIPDGDTTTTDLNVTSSLASATWESIGPTGSGADNIWAQLDDLPESAAILIVDVSISMIPTSTTSPAVISLYATSGGIASPTADTHKNRVISSVFDVNASTTVQNANTQRVLIPLHTDQTFKMYWATSNVTGSIVLYYRGFMSD